MFSDIQKKCNLHSNHFPNYYKFNHAPSEWGNRQPNEQIIPTAIVLLIPTPGQTHSRRPKMLVGNGVNRMLLQG